MTIAVGPAKQVRVKKETTWGTAAGTSGGPAGTAASYPTRWILQAIFRAPR